MRDPRSYIVRIYRQGFRSLSGVVEDTHSGGMRSFHSAEKLLALLRAPIPHIAPIQRRGRSRSTQ
jgi:hypothetical protein